MFKKILHEPLVHFLVLGALVFFIYAIFNNTQSSNENKIVISKAQQQQMAYRWQKKHMRPATQDEMQKMIDKNVYTEVMYREGLKMGLEKNDLIIKRRLTQKMEFITSDLTQEKKPTNDELLKYLDEHKKQFMLPSRISFRIKENTMLPKDNNELTAFEVSRIFGKVFTEELFKLEANKWIKDVRSAYGSLTVFVTGKTSEKLPEFKNIEKKLTVAWMNRQKEKTDTDFYNNLKKEYTVEIEK